MKINGVYLSVELENELHDVELFCKDSNCKLALSLKGLSIDSLKKVHLIFENSASAREIKLKLAALQVETFDHN
jgi:hypothetical protein